MGAISKQRGSISRRATSEHNQGQADRYIFRFQVLRHTELGLALTCFMGGVIVLHRLPLRIRFRRASIKKNYL